ncbi:hypothetical protein BASA81_006207 [Batrachochytrium salamandrivorans]|nr:hypothetical protein BASA81_006207 [Batrachochytrium salamandrivorans]
MNVLLSRVSSSSSHHKSLRGHGDNEFEYESQGAQWFTQYFRFCERNGKGIFFFWCLFLVFGLYFGPEFLTMGDDRATAPDGTRARMAEIEFESRFQDQSSEIPMLILVDVLNPSTTVADKRLFEFASQLHSTVLTYNSTHENVRSVLSYYAMSHTLLDKAKNTFVNDKQSATFLTIMVSGDQITQDRYEFVQFMQAQINSLNPNPKEFFIGLTGLDAMLFDTSDSAAKNMMKTDAFSVPVAMALLGYMIHSWRLLLFSFMNMGVSILGSFAVMAVAVKYFGAPHPESASSQLMEVITLAVSIDWSLFLNRRYRDEIKQGADHRKAAYLSLMHSGHVVIMSGATLFVVFIAFLALPAATVQMDGACCAMGVFIALLVALSNTPAVWLAFPNFCSDFHNKCCKDKTLQELNEEANRMGLLDHDHHQQLDEALLASIPDVVDEEEEEDGLNNQSMEETNTAVHVMYSGPRFRFTRWVTKFPNNIFSIVLVYLLVIPFAFQVKDLVLNQDILSSMPRGSKSAQTFKRAFDNFPGGTFSPFYVLITSKSSDDVDVVLTQEFFKAAQDCAVLVYQESQAMDNRFTKASVNTPVFLEGNTISLNEAKVFLATAKTPECSQKDSQVKRRLVCSTAKTYEFAWKQMVNADGNAMLITITVPFFPFASESSKYIDVVNKVVDTMILKHPQYDFYLSGTVVGFDAMQRRVVELFPRLLITTFLIVFVILGVLLRSLFVPVRLALTLIAPLCAVFGSAVLVYQKGALEWMHWVPLGRMDGFFWYLPILLLSMIIGLSLDWDVLLMSRIMEHRENGYDIRASICKAVCETGGTISVAGIIMCLAFGGMLLSDQLMINSAGFVLTIALLLDTFVVNTTLVPALISIGDKVAWFPAKMPMENLKTLDNCNEFPKD